MYVTVDCRVLSIVASAFHTAAFCFQDESFMNLTVVVKDQKGTVRPELCCYENSPDGHRSNLDIYLLLRHN